MPPSYKSEILQTEKLTCLFPRFFNRSSLSAQHSRLHHSTPTPLQLDPDEAALLITPHAISAGLASAPRRQITRSDKALSNRSPSLPDARGRAWGRRNSTRSHSHRPARGTIQIRSLSRKSNQPVTRLPPSNLNDTFIASRSPIRTEQVALRFLARVANRIMTVDSDTVTMVADAVAPQVRPRRSVSLSRAFIIFFDSTNNTLSSSQT